MEPFQKIVQQKLVAIIRGFAPDDAVSIAKALQEGGIEVLEIAMNSPKPLQTIEQMTDTLGDEVTVGAGTVLDPTSARSAILAGAEFILSPTLNTETIQLTKRYGAVSIPGAFTPTEILTAFEHGADIVKIFPASTLGPGYVKDLLGPLSQLKLLPTGGVNLDNVSKYIQNGAAGVGLGGSLVHKTDKVTDAYLSSITEKAKQFVDQVRD